MKITRRQIVRSSKKMDVHPVLERVYLGRGLTERQDLSIKNLLHPRDLTGIVPAVKLLADVIKSGEGIVIVGDFDADGATACAVGVKALQLMGAKNVGYVIPNRLIHGYGLTIPIVEKVKEMSPGLLITVDSGISNVEEVAIARNLGIRVLITDHHIPGAALPPANAIINPNRRDDKFKSKNLAGVGVIFYVMMALRAQLRATGWFNLGRPEPNLTALLDLVALGTIADVVPLDHNNRILVQKGLQRIRSGNACPGVSAILEMAGCNHQQLVATDLGFKIGPRLNAAGRMDDMAVGVRCLLAESREQALPLAKELNDFNLSRRSVESKMKDQALENLESIQMDGDLPWGLALFKEGWHPGVIGILASRIKDKYHRPVIAFANGDNSTLRGSMRSIPGLHARDALDSLARQHPGLILAFGGHAMAAGLKIPKNKFDFFSKEFDKEVRCRLKPEDLSEEILSDGEINPKDLTLSLAEEIRAAGPWGQGFPEPIFDGIFQCVEAKSLNGLHTRLKLSVGGIDPIGAIAFNCTKDAQVLSGASLHIAYRLDVNEYQGKKSLQLNVQYIMQ